MHAKASPCRLGTEQVQPRRKLRGVNIKILSGRRTVVADQGWMYRTVGFHSISCIANQGFLTPGPISFDIIYHLE